jgi:hypothetical protein
MSREEAEAKVRKFLDMMRLLAINPDLQTALEVLCDDARGLPRVADGEPFCACGRPMNECDGSRAGCRRAPRGEDAATTHHP